VQLLNADDPTSVIVLTGNPYTDPLEAVKLEPFCLACHDGNGAAGAAPFSDGLMPSTIDATAYKTTPHGIQKTCADCHVNGHGSNNSPLLEFQYVTADPNPYTAGDYQMCWKCHNPADIVSNTMRNAYNREHWRHVNNENLACAMCHNPHAPFDTGESGLVSFEYAIQRGYNIGYLNGRNGSSSFSVTASTGTCYIACHGENHNPETYQRFDIISAAADMWRETVRLFLPLITSENAPK
jgi:hypothetical protein